MAKINRREFLSQAGNAALAAPFACSLVEDERAVALVHDPADPVASAQPVLWAAGRLRSVLERRKVRVDAVDNPAHAQREARTVVIAGAASETARKALGKALPAGVDTFAIANGRLDGRPLLVACGGDTRGLVYALLELADRIDLGEEPFAALEFRSPLQEKPANPIRSVTRLFASEVEDRGWYHDRKFWDAYLSHLAAQRFNRFSLALGMGFDFLNDVNDPYFHFAYPFLVAPAGYRVKLTGLPDEERERNLQTLRFVSEAVRERGLHFQLGLWTHGYTWPMQRDGRYMVEGLTPENHAAYCRDALRLLLRTCPAISGVTFRIHGESGVPEATYPFWKTVFEGVATCGRKVEIDMHAKGIDQEMIDAALATGMPVNVSPKFWAEHLGLPYHQAAIRALEMPPKDRPDAGFFAKSDGSRRFLRYGYGDLLNEERKYGVLFRVWPGTQRFLLWGDPGFAEGYGRAAGFCGSLGMELCEPLSFKGRKGSGRPGGRDAYADTGLKTTFDFEKHLLTYRLWGRGLYNPETVKPSCDRALAHDFGPSGKHCGGALSHASRILPLITTAHLPSAANNGYWPEIYTNMPMREGAARHPYGDTPNPKEFGAVSPLDPELFSSIAEFAGEFNRKQIGPKYSPLEVAAWLEDLAREAEHHLALTPTPADERNPAFRRLVADVSILAAVGRFFAHKLRAGVFFAVSQSEVFQEEALAEYRKAADAWAAAIGAANGCYVDDITYGSAPHLRGSWANRLPAINADVADLAALFERVSRTSHIGHSAHEDETAKRNALMKRPERPHAVSVHRPPGRFRPGEPFSIEIETRPDSDEKVVQIDLQYRPVNQGMEWQAARMAQTEWRWRIVIPGSDTAVPFPLQYYFILRNSQGKSWLYPGLNSDLTGQPYYVVRSTAARGRTGSGA